MPSPPTLAAAAAALASVVRDACDWLPIDADLGSRRHCRTPAAAQEYNNREAARDRVLNLERRRGGGAAERERLPRPGVAHAAHCSRSFRASTQSLGAIDWGAAVASLHREIVGLLGSLLPCNTQCAVLLVRALSCAPCTNAPLRCTSPRLASLPRRVVPPRHTTPSWFACLLLRCLFEAEVGSTSSDPASVGIAELARDPARARLLEQRMQGPAPGGAATSQRLQSSAVIPTDAVALAAGEAGPGRRRRGRRGRRSGGRAAGGAGPTGGAGKGAEGSTAGGEWGSEGSEDASAASGSESDGAKSAAARGQHSGHSARARPGRTARQSGQQHAPVQRQRQQHHLHQPRRSSQRPDAHEAPSGRGSATAAAGGGGGGGRGHAAGAARADREEEARVARVAATVQLLPALQQAFPQRRLFIALLLLLADSHVLCAAAATGARACPVLPVLDRHTHLGPPLRTALMRVLRRLLRQSRDDPDTAARQLDARVCMARLLGSFLGLITFAPAIDRGAHVPTARARWVRGPPHCSSGSCGCAHASRRGTGGVARIVGGRPAHVPRAAGHRGALVLSSACWHAHAGGAACVRICAAVCAGNLPTRRCAPAPHGGRAVPDSNVRAPPACAFAGVLCASPARTQRFAFPARIPPRPVHRELRGGAVSRHSPAAAAAVAAAAAADTGVAAFAAASTYSHRRTVCKRCSGHAGCRAAGCPAGRTVGRARGGRERGQR